MSKHEREFELAKALALASNDNTINSVPWDGLTNHTQWRMIYLARLAMKMEEDSR